MDDPIGQLGNYRVLRLLGQGAFADVYLGEHIHLRTQAAIKTDELIGIECHHLGLAVTSVVFPGETDFAVGERDEPAVGDGDAMGIGRHDVQRSHRRSIRQQACHLLCLLWPTARLRLPRQWNGRCVAGHQ